MKMSYEKCMTRQAFKNPTQKINEQYILIDMKVKSLQNSILLKIKEDKTKFVKEVAKLDALSPLKTLTRGYSIISKQDGRIAKEVKDLSQGEKVSIRLSDGSVDAQVL